jgi:hypothetical protein
MSRKSGNPRYAVIGEKDIWHRVDLQKIRDDKFVYVANQILKGRFKILELKSQNVLPNLEIAN